LKSLLGYAKLVMGKCKHTLISLSGFITFTQTLFEFKTSLTPLAVTNDLRQGIVQMAIDEQHKKLVSAGFDRIIMIWNVSNML
jgi:hypothetical protein